MHQFSSFPSPLHPQSGTTMALLLLPSLFPLLPPPSSISCSLFFHIPPAISLQQGTTAAAPLLSPPFSPLPKVKIRNSCYPYHLPSLLLLYSLFSPLSPQLGTTIATLLSPLAPPPPSSFPSILTSLYRQALLSPTLFSPLPPPSSDPSSLLSLNPFLRHQGPSRSATAATPSPLLSRPSFCFRSFSLIPPMLPLLSLPSSPLFATKNSYIHLSPLASLPFSLFFFPSYYLKKKMFESCKCKRKDAP